MINSLESWLEAASELFASQSKKLNLFQKHQIYSEYWVQNELATLLPWGQQGIYLVDCGAPIVLVTGEEKYPDFTIRFSDVKGSPLYFIELKDLIANPLINAKKLQSETAAMAGMDREATKVRWSKHNGKASDFADLMVEALDSAPVFFLGLAVGAVTDMPIQLSGFNTTKIQINDNWQIGVFELNDHSEVISGADKTSSRLIGTEETFSVEANISDSLLPSIWEAVQGCEEGKCLTVAEIPISSLIEAQLLAAQIELLLRDNTQNGLPTIRHAKPWVWSAQSTGKPMTKSGSNAGIEIRFSYYSTEVR